MRSPFGPALQACLHPWVTPNRAALAVMWCKPQPVRNSQGWYDSRRRESREGARYLGCLSGSGIDYSRFLYAPDAPIAMTLTPGQRH